MSGRPRRRRITVSLAQVTSTVEGRSARGGGGGEGCWWGMRALHNSDPNHSKNMEKYHMGRSDHSKIQHYAASKEAFNILTQSSYCPISQTHYCSMITYLKSFKWQVKWAGRFIQIIVNGSFKIPPESRSPPVFLP